RDPRYIQTILKRGYRLIAPVTALRQAALRYEVIEKLGEGGMAEVFLARDVELQRKVALKFIRAGEAEEESGRKRLLREARAAAALDHPFIAKIFDTGRMDGRTFIAMEHIEGRTLKQKLAKGRLEIKEALRIAMEIAEALEAAHDRGIVHRDLKPSNIMITPQGHVKVMDFGLAKRLPQADQSASLEETVSALTKEGTTAGTLPYMSPEQLRAEAVDHRSDIFSLGIVLYEMLTGIHPFQKANAIETAGSILRDAPPPLKDRLPGSAALLEHAIGKLLAKDIGRRYQTVHDARTDLADVMDAPPTPEITPTERRGALPRSRSVGLTIALGAPALVLAGAALAFLAFFQHGPEPMDLGGYSYTPFAAEATQEVLGAWSPDGSSVAYPKEFAGARSWEWHVMARSLDSSVPTRLTLTPPGVSYWVPPFWSADGSRVLFVQAGNVWSVSAAGGEPEQVFPQALAIWYATLSPDGASIALWRQVKREGGYSHSVWISSPPGSEPRLYEPQVL
ncbi:MAG: serine/threonine-protein kinase, partial [Acidobacteria bacterium]|nr:serine/threonine-protein kinase [Acidobacteriota bacterium]